MKNKSEQRSQQQLRYTPEALSPRSRGSSVCETELTNHKSFSLTAMRFNPSKKCNQLLRWLRKSLEACEVKRDSCGTEGAAGTSQPSSGLIKSTDAFFWGILPYSSALHYFIHTVSLLKRVCGSVWSADESWRGATSDECEIWINTSLQISWVKNREGMKMSEYSITGQMLGLY